MGGYLDYADFMAEIDGRPVDREARARRWAELGITTRDIEWRGGPGDQGSATVFYERGVPRHVAWFVWSLSEESFVARLEADFGRKFRLTNHAGGNGHYSADIEIL